jgi:uncharacterized membrane protein YdjX (TVP38/TMEM64 family)
MTIGQFLWKYKIVSGSVVLVVCLVLGYLFGGRAWELIVSYFYLLSDREQIQTLVASYGVAAPAVFIAIQIFQVLFAPIPGEASGFIGGYLFGAGWGFLYSSIGLSAGSWLNFKIGRFLGAHYVRKLIPIDKLERFEALLKRQGVIVVFILFVFPGFPKDYLCLFLGLSDLPVSVFIVLAVIGRMPGTFVLSLQGSLLFEKMYGWLGLIFGLCALIAFLAYWRRDAVYRWVERADH